MIKVKITKPDGTIIELEGNAADLALIPILQQPCTVIGPFVPISIPNIPYYPPVYLNPIYPEIIFGLVNNPPYTTITGTWPNQK